MHVRRLMITFAFAALTAPASAGDLVGQASVIDGDTIEIHGERIRILDIDAPESRQTCRDVQGTEWRCGQKATLVLSDWIAQQTVSCVSTKFDKYRRHLAHCSVGTADMAEWLADQGWAVPYRDCKCEILRAACQQARSKRLGI